MKEATSPTTNFDCYPLIDFVIWLRFKGGSVKLKLIYKSKAIGNLGIAGYFEPY